MGVFAGQYNATKILSLLLFAVFLWWVWGQGKAIKEIVT